MRKIYDGMKVDLVKKYKDLGLDNAHLKKLVADPSLRKVMLKEKSLRETSKPATSGSPCGTKHKSAAQVLMQKYSLSERLACELVGLSRVVTGTCHSPEMMRSRLEPRLSGWRAPMDDTVIAPSLA